MAQKIKTRDITIIEETGTFTTFFKKIAGDTKNYDFEGLSVLRKLLSNEKAKILHTIKKDHPKSLYHLAKLVGRDFKSVSDDINLLKRLGFVELISEKTGERERLKPIVTVDTINISIKI